MQNSKCKMQNQGRMKPFAGAKSYYMVRFASEYPKAHCPMSFLVRFFTPSLIFSSVIRKFCILHFAFS